MTAGLSRPRLVAHRGAHDERRGPRENTLAAIRAAIAAGADAVEVDVRLTADGAVVLLHDDTLTRLWGDPRAVADVELTDLRRIGGGERTIPLLAEALDAVRGTGTCLLVDMDEPAPAAAAAAVVADAEGVSTAWCGHLDAMRVIRRELPDAEIWMPWYTAVPPTAEDLAELRPTTVNIQHLLVGAHLVEAVHDLGAALACWTVDDAAQAVWLAGIGVDSVTTNDVAAMRAEIARPSRPPAHERERVVVAELARHAATRIARAWTEGAGAVRTKSGPADHVTEVDRSIEQAVRAVIGAQFPAHAFVGEEFGGTDHGDRPCWFLDPVDGTANLAGGVPWTSFSLALAEGGRPVVGAVLDPAGLQVPGPVPVVAVAGRGAWRSGQRLQVPQVVPEEIAPDPLAGAIVTTELAGARPWPGLERFLGLLAERHATLRIPGSGTASLAGVALGRGVATVIHRFNPIDHAAAVLVVLEAGGVVLDTTGAATAWPDGAVVAARDEATAHAVLDLWRQATDGG